ncbi:MAG: nicotinamide-nucleotide amidase [Gammaproteobacteria bacterium]|jgi:nicotinamide-nucleotide amidase
MNLQHLSEQVGQRLLEKQLWLATAESCTGGWISQSITDIAGSSQWFDRGFVTYSNEAKQDMLGVSQDTLEQHGAVSEQTVIEMVQGALAQSRADVAVAVSGVAGPAGGTPDKPVGMVWLAWGVRGEQFVTQVEHYLGNRSEVRQQTVETALQGLLKLLA